MTKTKYANIRLPEDIKAALVARAAKESRTIAAQILHYIKIGLAQSGTKIL